MTEHRPCIFCRDGHPVAATRIPATATLRGATVEVTITERLCERTGEAFRHSRDPDHKAEARAKLNAALGQDPDTRLPGVTYTPLAG